MTPSPSRSRRMLFGTGVVAAVALTLAATAPASGSPGQHHGKPRLAHAFIIMEENHAQDHVIGDPNMPFTNSLATSYNQATNFYGVTHTSEPNYIAATSGSNWDVNNDNGWNPTTKNPATNHYDHTNIVDELEAAHISWGAYMDGMPSAGYLPDQWPETGGALYASKHNPFVLYNDVRNNPARLAHIKPMNSLATDLNSAHAPRYVWISPDQCNDLHGGIYSPIAGHPETPCPYNNAPGDANDEALKTKADTFLKATVNTIMHSKAWTPGSVIFITADETDYDASSPDNNFYLSTAGCCDSPVLPAGDPAVSATWPGGVYGGGLIPMIVVTNDGPRQVNDDTAYNHYSMLLTIEQGFGLTKLGFTSDSQQVKPMWSLISNH